MATIESFVNNHVNVIRSKLMILIIIIFQYADTIMH